MTEDEIKKIEILINKCEECKFATCEQCEINWSQIQIIRKLLNLYRIKELDNIKLRHDSVKKDVIKNEIKELENNGYWNYLEYSDLKRTIKLLETIIAEKTVDEE